MVDGEIVKEFLSFLKDWIKYPLERIGKQREHDKNLYLEIYKIIPSDLIQDFFVNLGYNRYGRRHSKALFEYVYFSERADKYFINKKIRTAKEKFDLDLYKLLDFLTHHFSYPDRPENADFLQLYRVKDEYIENAEAAQKFNQIFIEEEEELIRLSKDVKEKYNFFVKTIKNKLMI